MPLSQSRQAADPYGWKLLEVQASAFLDNTDPSLQQTVKDLGEKMKG